MMDLSQTYMRESDRVESLFTYKMSLVPTNGQVRGGPYNSDS